SEMSRLLGHRLDKVVKQDYSWTFVFSDDLKLQVECLWRLIVSGRIQITSEDHGHQFGLPAPVDCVEELRRQVVGATVAEAKVRAGTIDVSLDFDTGGTLEVISTSAGYEAWQLNGPNVLIVGHPGYES
ncbi:MAG: DUF6188 family protein, partial [Gemmataceae bacterium]